MEWVAIPFSRDQTQVSLIAGRFFTIWATRGSPNKLHMANQMQQQLMQYQQNPKDTMSSSHDLLLKCLLGGGGSGGRGWAES